MSNVQSSKHRRAVVLTAVLGLVVLGDLLAAQLARVALPQPDFAAAERQYRILVEPYHHGLKPSTRALSHWGGNTFELHTNSLGFKDAEVRAVPLRVTEHRVIFLGDSFTEGVGVPYPETFVGRIDVQWRGQGIDVLNAAAASYSPSIYYAKTKHLLDTVGLQIDELIVFLDVSDIHDEAVVVQLTDDARVVDAPNPPAAVGLQAPPDNWTSLLKKASISIRIADAVKDRLFPINWQSVSDEAPYFQEHFVTPRAAWTHDEAQWREHGEHGLRRATAAMTLLATMLAERSIPLTLAIYPWPTQLLRPSGNDRYVTHWKTWAREQGVQLIDLFPGFVEGGTPRELLHAYFIPLDCHWNSRGHSHVAESFLALYAPPSEAAPAEATVP